MATRPNSKLPDRDKAKPRSSGKSKASGEEAAAAGGPDIAGFVGRLQRAQRTRDAITMLKRFPARAGEYAEMPAFVPGWLATALAGMGKGRPYCHQAEAWTHIHARRHTVVVTPTASGKTLCYNVPIASMLREEEGSALYLYPTKALSQDQCAELNDLFKATGIEELAHVYDGDTPADLRRAIRDRARAVLTNPDMLHQSILPNHDRWRRLFSTLRFVVIDEMHTYRGVFGSHVANVIRRLQRICRHYGSAPQFVFTSATIANPGELAENLIGEPAVVVDRSGAPSGERLFMLYNPPILNPEDGRRQSPGSAAQQMVVPLLEEGAGAIVFARSRQGVEVLTRRIRETLTERRKKDLAGRVDGYRGGYLPEDRRRIERGLRAGTIRGVVTTNALELGIDIGALDVAVLAGYPGTIASTWQQAGRAGRRQSTALVVLVAGSDPVDQYLITHPESFFEASPEFGRIDPDNLRILAEHLRCAVYELPIRTDEAYGRYDVEETQGILDWVAEHNGPVQCNGTSWRWNGEGYPAQGVNLRDMADENFVIIDTTQPRKPNILGEIDFEGAHTTVYEKAIYSHSGELYEVHRLDYKDRKAYVRAVSTDYYTQAIDQTRVFVLDVTEEREGSRPFPGEGEVRVAKRVVGYKKIRMKTFENIGYGEIALPDLDKHTTSYWCVFPSPWLDRLGVRGDTLAGALTGISRVMHTLALVHLMCAAEDLLVTVSGRQGDAWETLPDNVAPLGPPTIADDPAVFLYDRYPGGVGFSEQLFRLHDDLLRKAEQLVESCPCGTGCPSCVGPVELIGEGGRAAALRILRAAVADLAESS